MFRQFNRLLLLSSLALSPLTTLAEANSLQNSQPDTSVSVATPSQPTSNTLGQTPTSQNNLDSTDGDDDY